MLARTIPLLILFAITILASSGTACADQITPTVDASDAATHDFLAASLDVATMALPELPEPGESEKVEVHEGGIACTMTLQSSGPQTQFAILLGWSFDQPSPLRAQWRRSRVNAKHRPPTFLNVPIGQTC